MLPPDYTTDEDDVKSDEIDDYFFGFHEAKDSIALTHQFHNERHEYLLEKLSTPKHSKRHSKKRNKKKNKNTHKNKIEIKEKGWRKHQRIATLNRTSTLNRIETELTDGELPIIDIEEYNNNNIIKKNTNIDTNKSTKHRHNMKLNNSSTSLATEYIIDFDENKNDNMGRIVRIPSDALSLIDITEYNDPLFWNNNNDIYDHKNSIYESGSIDFTIDGSVGNNNSNNSIKKDKLKKLAQKQIFIQDINDIFKKKYNKKWMNELCNNDNDSGHWDGLNINNYISLVPNLIFLSKSFFETNEANYIFNLVIDGIQTLIQSYDIKRQMIKQLYLAFERDIDENKMKLIKYTQLQMLEKQILYIGDVKNKLKNNPFLSKKAFNNNKRKQNNYVNEFKFQLENELMELYNKHAQLAKKEQFKAIVKLKQLKNIEKKKRLFAWFNNNENEHINDDEKMIEERMNYDNYNKEIIQPMGGDEINIDNYSLYFILLCLLLRYYNNGRNILSFTISRTSIRITELGDKILNIFGIITKCGNIYRILCYLKICMKILSTEASYFDDILQRLSLIQEYLNNNNLITLREELHLKKIINTICNWCKLCIIRYQHVFFGPMGPRALKSCLRCWKFCLLMLYKLNKQIEKINTFEHIWCEKIKETIKKSIYDYEFPRLVELYNTNNNKTNNTDSPIEDATQLIMVIKACRKYLILDEQEYEITFNSYCKDINFSLLKITSSQYMTLTFSFSNLYLRVLAIDIKEKILLIEDEFEIDASVWALYQELKRFYDDLKKIYKLLRKKNINCSLPEVHYADHYNDIIAYWSQYQNIKFTNPYNGYVIKLCNNENWKKISENLLYSNSIIDLFNLIDPLQYWFLNLPYTNENLLDFAKLLTSIIKCYVNTLHEKITKYLLKELEKKELAFYTKNKKYKIIWNFPKKLMIAVNDIIMAKTQLQETINKLMLDRRFNTVNNTKNNTKNNRIIKHTSIARYHTLKQTMLLTPELLFGHIKQQDSKDSDNTINTINTFYKHKILPSEFNYNYFDEENDIQIWNSLNCIEAFQIINKSLSSISYLIAQGLNSDISHEIVLLLWENEKFPQTLLLTKEQVEDELMDMLWKKLCTKCDLLNENISQLFIPYILTDFFSLICLDFIKLLIPKRLKYVLNLNQLTRIEYAIQEIQNFLLDCYNIQQILIQQNENLYKLKHVLNIQLSGTVYLINHHKELHKDPDFHDKYQLNHEPFLGPKSLWLIIKHRTKHHKHDQVLINYYQKHSSIKAQIKSFTTAVRNKWG